MSHTLITLRQTIEQVFQVVLLGTGILASSNVGTRLIPAYRKLTLSD